MPETPEQERQRVTYSITALSNGITIHKRKLAVMEQREKVAAAEVLRLKAALEIEQTEREKLRVQIAEADTTDRALARDVESLAKHVEALDQSQAVQIRKSTAPNSTVITTRPVRDENGRITETITEDEARPGVAIIRRVIRDASYRIVGSETYECPMETEDES